MAYDEKGPGQVRDVQRDYGWYALVPEGVSDDELDDAPTGFRAGSTVRFSSDVTVDVPLWDDADNGEGLLFNNGEELVRVGGISQELADEVVAWGRASQGPATPELDAEAARLIRRLRDELNGEVRFLYQP